MTTALNDSHLANFYCSETSVFSCAYPFKIVRLAFANIPPGATAALSNFLASRECLNALQCSSLQAPCVRRTGSGIVLHNLINKRQTLVDPGATGLSEQKDLQEDGSLLSFPTVPGKGA